MKNAAATLPLAPGAGTVAVIGLVVSGSFFDGAVAKKEAKEARESKMEQAAPILEEAKE